MRKLSMVFLMYFCLALVFFSACRQKTEGPGGSVENPDGIIAESISVPEPVLMAARDYVQRDYDYWCNSTGYYGAVDGEERMIGEPAFYDDWRIEGLFLVHSYDELDGQPVNEFNQSYFVWSSVDVYRLDYRIHTTTPERVKTFLAGGMDLDNEGWLLPGYPESTYLIFSSSDGYLQYLLAMMENDCLPGDETFTHDLETRLNEMKDQHKEALRYLRGLFADDETTIWYVAAGEESPQTIPEKLSYVRGHWYKGRYEVQFNCDWTRADSSSFREPAGASLCLGDSTERYFEFYLGTDIVVWRDGEDITVWRAADSWGNTLPGMMMSDFSLYEVGIDNVTVPVIDGEAAEDTLRRFLDAYGAYLAHMTPENSYRIEDYKVLDFYEIRTSDTRILLRYSPAVKPPEELYRSTPWWAGNSEGGEGELEGWLCMYSEIVLERLEDVWRCISCGTGGASLD